MTNRNQIIDEITAAIESESAHEIAEVLDELGVSVTKCGKYASTDEACDVAGFGVIFRHDLPSNPGWVVRFDGDNAIEPDELVCELVEIVDMTARIRE